LSKDGISPWILRDQDSNWAEDKEANSPGWNRSMGLSGKLPWD
jgi:hypothetical protein